MVCPGEDGHTKIGLIKNQAFQTDCMKMVVLTNKVIILFKRIFGYHFETESIVETKIFPLFQHMFFKDYLNFG